MPEKIEIALQVTTPVQDQALRDAWHEIVTGQAGRLVRFLTSVCKGSEFPSTSPTSAPSTQSSRMPASITATRTASESARRTITSPAATGRDRYELLDGAVDDLIAKYRRNASAPKP